LRVRSSIATGIQLADRAVGAVCLAREGRALRLVEAVWEPLNRTVDPVLLGGHWGRPAVVEALAALRRRLPSDLGTVTVGLAHGAYLLKMPAVPYPLPQGWLQVRRNLSHLRWEMDQALGDEAPAYVCDAASVGDRGLVVAARRAVLDAYAGVCGQAGLPEPCFDVEALALHNIAEAAGLLAPATPTVLVSSGGAGVDVVLLCEGRLRDIAHCQPLAAADGALAACVKQQCQHGAAAGGSVDPASVVVWAAGVGAPRTCAALGGALGCTAGPLPWHKVLAAAAEPEEAARLGVAAGLAVRRLSG
jgi:hypothetical protein